MINSPFAEHMRIRDAFSSPPLPSTLGCEFTLYGAATLASGIHVSTIVAARGHDIDAWHHFVDIEADEWQLLWLTDGPRGWREFPYFPALAAITFIWAPSERNDKMGVYDEIPQTADVEQAAGHGSPDALVEEGLQTAADNDTSE